MSDKRVIGRVCAICGKRRGNTEPYNTFLRRTGVPGEKAHPACVQGFGMAYENLFDLRCRSKRGDHISPQELQFLRESYKKWPSAYRAIGATVFEETKPFGSVA